MRSCQRTQTQPFCGCSHLNKLERWKNPSGCLASWPKVKKILIMCNKGPFLICIVMCNEKWILYTQQMAMTSSVVGAEKLQNTSQAKPAPKNGHGHWCSGVQLTQYSFLNPGETIIPEKHTKQINERHWKMQCLQQVLVNRSSSSPWQHPTAHRITNTSKKLNNWATKFASPTTFTWPLAKWLKHLNSFLQGKCFPKIYWIPKHVFLLYRNKQTFLVGKNMLIIMVYILINNDVWT